MSRWALIAAGALYLFVAIGYAGDGKFPAAIAFVCYAIANVCFALAL